MSARMVDRNVSASWCVVNVTGALCILPVVAPI